MANEEEKIILQADLYDNPLTEVEGDFTARLRISGSLRNSHIAQRIIDRGSEFRKETIVHLLDIADQEKVKAIVAGKSVVDGTGQIMMQLRGNFGGESAPYNPEKHTLVVCFIPGKALRKAMQQVTVQTNKATTGPIINTIIDPSTQKENETIQPSLPLIIQGVNLKVAATGDNAAGVFFVTADGATQTPAMLLVHNNPSELTVVAPTLADGEYYVEVRTQYAASNKMVKEPRTYRYPVLLTVGEGSGGDRPEIE